MKRGEIWTVAGPGDYLSKPRPAVVVQSNGYDATDSITICALTTDPSEAPFFRPEIQPGQGTGLVAASRVMVDKVTTVRRDRLGRRLGQLSREDTLALNRAIASFLGLQEEAAGSPA